MLLRLLAFTSSAQPAPAPALVRVARIWDTGAHDAFTDLIRWRDRWYCAFREADAHVGGDGRIRVLVSADGEAWTSAALIGEERIDLRDPKLSLTPDGRLMIVAGAETFPIPHCQREPRPVRPRSGCDIGYVSSFFAARGQRITGALRLKE